jgi:O-antigen/teichoic acid export membrane protein
LVALATAPMLARSLGVNGRGEFAAATVPLLLVTSVATLGMPEATVYLVARLRRSAWMTFRASAGVLSAAGAVSTLVLVVLAPTLSDGNAGTAVLIRVLALGCIPALVGAGARAVAAARQDWARVNAEAYLATLLRNVPIVVLFLFGALRLVPAAVIILVSTVLPPLIYLPVLRLVARLPQAAEAVRARDLVDYGSRTWVGTFAGIALARVDQVMMAPLAGLHETGLYAAAVTVGEVPLLISGAVRDVFFSRHSAEPDLETLAKGSRSALLATIAIGLPIGLMLPIALPLLFGAGFSGAVLPAEIVLGSAVINAPGSVAGAALMAQGQPGRRGLALTCSALLNVVLIVALVPAMGAVGAALATIAASTAASAIGVRMLVASTPLRAGQMLRITTDDVRALCAPAARMISQRH